MHWQSMHRLISETSKTKEEEEEKKERNENIITESKSFSHYQEKFLRQSYQGLFQVFITFSGTF